jgi:lysophospholipase L1-like esterase
VVLCTPAVFGERPDGLNPFDGRLAAYTDLSKEVARDTGAVLVDLHAAFVAYEREHNPNDLSRGVLTYDGLHLTALGNQLVAHEIANVLQM